MRGGYNADESGYYIRTDRGLWIRSHWCQDTGTIRLGWQLRYQCQGLMIVTIDENGDPMGGEPASAPKYVDDPWVDVEPSMSLDRVETMTMGRGALRGFTMGLMRHEALLLAMGLGENSAEVAGWFEFPERGEFVTLDIRYMISGGTGAFSGLDGMVLAIKSASPGQAVKGVIVVDGNRERFDFEHDASPKFLADFVRSTTPID